MRASSVFVGLSLAALTVYGSPSPRRVELQIIDQGAVAAGVAVSVVWRDDRSLIAQSATANTDANGFVTFEVPEGAVITLRAPDLSSNTRQLSIDHEPGAQPRWRLTPREWTAAPEAVIAPTVLLPVSDVGGTTITFTIDCWNDAFPSGQGGNCDFCTNTLQTGVRFTYNCNGGTRRTAPPRARVARP